MTQHGPDGCPHRASRHLGRNHEAGARVRPRLGQTGVRWAGPAPARSRRQVSRSAAGHGDAAGILRRPSWRNRGSGPGPAVPVGVPTRRASPPATHPDRPTATTACYHAGPRTHVPRTASRLDPTAPVGLCCELGYFAEMHRTATPPMVPEQRLSQRAHWAGGEPIASMLMAKTLGQPDLISLAAGFVDHELLPVEADAAGGGDHLVAAPPRPGRTAIWHDDRASAAAPGGARSDAAGRRPQCRRTGRQHRQRGHHRRQQPVAVPAGRRAVRSRRHRDLCRAELLRLPRHAGQSGRPRGGRRDRPVRRGSRGRRRRAGPAQDRRRVGPGEGDLCHHLLRQSQRRDRPRRTPGGAGRGGQTLVASAPRST